MGANMKRTTITICALALLGIACYAWARSTVVSVVQGAAAAAGTTYLSQTFEGWSDLTGFSASDQSPANQILFDTTSKVSGANSIRHDAQDGGGGTSGSLAFAYTEFYASVEVYISSAGSAPTNSDVIFIWGVGPSGGSSQGVQICLAYDTDHFEYNAFIRDDAGTANWLIGSSGITGSIITADTKHTIYLYYKGGTNGSNNGEVWIALDSGAWATKTGLEQDAKAAAFAVMWVGMVDSSGSHAAGEWDYYTDNLFGGDYDPLGR
jgi:hypothetical protein